MLATDSARPKTRPAPIDQPSQWRKRHAEQRGADDLHDGAGNGDGAHREQLLEREVQAHAEHQKNDADLGELAGERLDRRRSPASPDRSARRQGDSRRSAASAADGRAAPNTQASARAMTMVVISGCVAMGRSGPPQASAARRACVPPRGARRTALRVASLARGRTASRTSSIMARAISSSPMITVEAPCFFRCTPPRRNGPGQ